MRIPKLILYIVFCITLCWVNISVVRADDEPALKDVFADDFLIGGALNRFQIFGQIPRDTALIIKHFSTVTPENVLKWQRVHPEPDRYDFEAADQLVALGREHNMFIVGHTLVWHHQTPSWVFEGAEGNTLDREALLKRMKDHIFTVVGRYKGKIQGWDVVNEAIGDDGNLRDTPWRRIIGDDYIAKAFEYAHEADPEAELYYNDFDMWKKDHYEGAIRLVNDLKSKGLRVDGIGFQGHWGFGYPYYHELEASIIACVATGAKIMITELDISVLPDPGNIWGADISRNAQLRDELNPYPDGLPDEMQQKLARRYVELFSLFDKHSDKISRVTFWGVHDGSSWLNNWPVRGRTNYPLLFDRDDKPKPAFEDIMKAKQSKEDIRIFTNPIISGFYPDPSICRVGDDYYMVNSTFEFFPGVPVFHSKDLVNWQQIGYCLTTEKQLPLKKVRASGGIYAPTIRYHDGTFYMVTTNVDGGGNFYVTAQDPAGPWSDPVWLKDYNIDPSLLFDDDGTVYYTRHEGQGDGHIVQGILDIKTGKLGPLKKVWEGTGGIWPEGPHLYKIKGKYYLMISEGGTSYDHMVTIARSDSPFGPFEPCPDNPILTHRNRKDHPLQALGHADIVETPDGWWMVCLGIRPQPEGEHDHHIGRETFLAPVTWNSQGWPVVNGNGQLEETLLAPKLTPHPFKKPPARDDFDSDKLALQWNFLRNPYDGDFSLTARPGYLRLNGSAITLSDQDSPAFVGRRQRDLACKASVRLEFNPTAENEEAGLVIRGNEKNHYDIGITLKDGKRKVFLRKIVQGIAKAEYFDIPDGAVILTVSAAPLSYGFSCKASDGAVIPMGDALTRDMSSERVGGFTGVYFGMYATGNGKKSTTPADFDWFEYNPGPPMLR
ncbi:MAG: endo-1,4-beta-xylanase [Sedimentisphaerales bacterium]|nr:endo-1,4-beta-xylanase [Sedimentisphaerales bacterium]